MAGLQVIMDARALLHLSDRDGVVAWLQDAARLAGMTVLGFQSWTLPSKLDSGPGVSVTLELVESHAAIETWPEDGVVCLCFYSCKDWTPGPVLASFRAFFGVVEMLSYKEIRRWGRLP